MGERAVALVCLRDSVYWYRSQWGGADAMLADLFDAESPLSQLTAAEWTFCRRTDGLCLSRLDTLTADVVYIVSVRGVVVCCPLWFGLGHSSSPQPDVGVLLPTASLSAFRACRDALRRFKATLLESVHDETLTPEQARELLWWCYRLVEAVSRPRW